MDYKDIKIPKLLSKREVYPEPDANIPTLIDVHRCPCGKGTVEHHRVPGFGDDFLDIICPECDEKYKYAEVIGYTWRLYF